MNEADFSSSFACASIYLDWRWAGQRSTKLLVAAIQVYYSCTFPPRAAHVFSAPVSFFADCSSPSSVATLNHEPTVQSTVHLPSLRLVY